MNNVMASGQQKLARHWSRAILLVDMNAFFASIEQYDFAELQGRPVAVTNGDQGTCVITCSYEARSYGVKTGLRLNQARQLCPDLIQRPARPVRYAEVSTRIMDALQRISPQLEVFSVDEAFLDITACQRLLGPPDVIAQRVQKLVYEVSGLGCSIGVSGDKTTAKWAAKRRKPNGITCIHPDDRAEVLHDVPVKDLCGVNHGVGDFLAARGVYRCGDMRRIPISVLGDRFGNPGRRIWLMAQGKDPEPLIDSAPPPRTIGHGKVMPPATCHREVIQLYLQHMSFKVGERLRRHHLEASHFFFGLRTQDHASGWLAHKQRIEHTQSGRVIYQKATEFVDELWQGQGVCQVQITALDPRPAQQQMDLFAHVDQQHNKLDRVVDAVNQRYGEFSLTPAQLLARSTMPNVIAPSWKPYGHRQTIQDRDKTS